MSEQEVDQKFLFNIANQVNTIFECEGLAAYLDAGDRLVTHLKEKNVNEPQAIALEVLKTWAKRNGKQATRRALLDALQDCPLGTLQSLAKKLCDQLHKTQGWRSS